MSGSSKVSAATSRSLARTMRSCRCSTRAGGKEGHIFITSWNSQTRWMLSARMRQNTRRAPYARTSPHMARSLSRIALPSASRLRRGSRIYTDTGWCIATSNRRISFLSMGAQNSRTSDSWDWRATCAASSAPRVSSRVKALALRRPTCSGWGRCSMKSRREKIGTISRRYRRRGRVTRRRWNSTKCCCERAKQIPPCATPAR